MKVLIVMELTREEALKLSEETKEIEAGLRPVLHEFLNRIAEILEQ